MCLDVAIAPGPRPTLYADVLHLSHDEQVLSEARMGL